MNIGVWCIHNRVTVFAVLAVIFLGGVYTFKTISRLEDPDFTIRTAVITTAFPGATPKKVEELVTDVLEEKIREMAEVETVRSQSLTGVSIIHVDIFDKYRDVAPIWQKLRNKITDVTPELPGGVGMPLVNDEFGDVYGVVVALVGDGYTYREMKDVAEYVRDQLLKIDSVGKIEFHGIQDERIFIEFSNARLAEFGFSPAMLAQALADQNVIQPGGDALVGPERIILEATGEFKSVNHLKRTSLRVPGLAEALYLADIADVKRGFSDPPQFMARFDSQPAITISVNMAKGFNIVTMGKAVLGRLAELTVDLPVGLDFETVVYQPKYVDRSIKDFGTNLLEAFALVIIVVLAFAGMRTGLVVSTIVPLAMVSCFVMMPAFAIDLQSISIAALIIALGMLVDNGVVVSENILVRLAAGEERLAACANTVEKLWKPLLSASLTTIFAFMPLYIADSAAAEYCASLFLVVALTLLSSWLLSLTMMPLLCYLFLKPEISKQTFSSRFYKLYREILVGSLKHRTVFLAVVIGLTAAALWGMQFVPKIFFPPNDREMFLVDFNQPYGSDIRTTLRRLVKLEKHLLGKKEVVSVGTFVGNSGPRWYLPLNMDDSGPQYARLVVTTRTIEDTINLIQPVRAYLDENFPDTRHTVQKLEKGPPVGAPIRLRLSGDAIGSLYFLRDEIIKAIAEIPGVTNIRDDWGEWTKKLEVDVHQDRAKRAGLSSLDIALSLQTQISGLRATDFREGEEIIPIILRSKEAYREDLGKVESLNVYSFTDGRSVPLLQLADTKLVWQPSNIRRRDQVRTMEIKVDVVGRYASEVLADIMPEVEKLQNSAKWPTGYFLEYGGEKEDSEEASSSITGKLPLAFGLIVLLLISQFNSIRQPLIILLTIPPMFVGITVGLLITGSAFGFMALLGLLSLFGIIVNNAIMMIDQIIIESAMGQTMQDAIIISAQKRLRPIIMTAITTIFGLIPLAIQGGEFWRPMANVLIFGLAFGTVLTLALCPVLYSLFYRAQFNEYAWDQQVLEKNAD